MKNKAFLLLKQKICKKNIKLFFLNRSKFSKSQIKEISNLFSYTESEEKELLKSTKEITDLQQINYEDKIKLLTQTNISFSEFNAKIISISNNLSDYQKELIEALNAFSLAKVKNEQAIQSSQILATLPKSDTDEWKTFIQTGQDYSKIIKPTEPRKCPYCHQELKTDESLNIIQAYANFLNDTSETELKSAKEKLNEIREKIQNIDISITLSDELKNCLKEFLDIDSKITSLKGTKQSLLDAKSGDESKISIPDFKNELQKINSEINANKEKINSLESSKSDKEDKIKELNELIYNLKQKKAISEQKDEINNYFSIWSRIDTLTTKQSKFRTTDITRLANRANEELLTSTLKERLSNELNNLGRKDLKVILQTSKGSKGQCNTQLILKGKHKVTDILSEGEQKAVGLAVFFAEIQDENVPIILDDPTNSLDNKIINKLASRLLSFDNQIIIFTHYHFFLNSLNFPGKSHFCNKYGKSTCGKKNKHVYVYEIDEMMSGKGNINEYFNRDSKTMFLKIENELPLVSSGDLKDIPKNMRKCIEYLIDEVILKDQLLRKYNNGDNIDWEKLKEINPNNKNSIIRLHEIHGRVSGGEIHVGKESIENPPTPQEINSFLEDLKSIKEGIFI